MTGEAYRPGGSGASAGCRVDLRNQAGRLKGFAPCSRELRVQVPFMSSQSRGGGRYKGANEHCQRY